MQRFPGPCSGEGPAAQGAQRLAASSLESLLGGMGQPAQYTQPTVLRWGMGWPLMVSCSMLSSGRPACRRRCCNWSAVGAWKGGTTAGLPSARAMRPITASRTWPKFIREIMLVGL